MAEKEDSLSFRPFLSDGFRSIASGRSVDGIADMADALPDPGQETLPPIPDRTFNISTTVSEDPIKPKPRRRREPPSGLNPWKGVADAIKDAKPEDLVRPVRSRFKIPV